MARPQKNNADYFTHDANMRNDLKIRALRRKFGLEGYAIWAFLLEVLTDADYFRIEWDEFNQELLAGDFDIDSECLTEVVEYCCKLKLLQVTEDGFLESEQHQSRLEGLIERRANERVRKGVVGKENPDGEEFSAKKTTQTNSFPQVKHQNEGVSAKKTTQSKEEKSKEEKIVCEGTHTRTQEELELERQYELFGPWCEKHAPLALSFADPLTFEQFAWLYKTYGANRMKQCAADLHDKEAYKTHRNAMNCWKSWIKRINLAC